MAGNGAARAASTAARGAYFLDYARQVRPRVKMPLMITGGMRSRAVMDGALAEGACDVIGIARPLCVDPDCGAPLLSGQCDALPAPEATQTIAPGALGPNVSELAHKTAVSFGQLGWNCLQILRIGAGQEPDREMSVLDALLGYQASEAAALERWARPPQD